MTLPSAVATLRDPATIRARSANIAAAVAAGESRWFTLDDTCLDSVADIVATVTSRSYPTLDVPFHSRWRHLEAGRADRDARLRSLLGDDPSALARARIDLAVISVLLDAGAGAQWGWQEPGGARYTRSEGLAVASYFAFVSGAFSADPSDPLRVDAAVLRTLDSEVLARCFQVSTDNPLVGLDGRTALMQRLGAALESWPAVFGQPARPGGVFDHLLRVGRSAVHAGELLGVLLDTLSSVWLSASTIAGKPLGDCWRHPHAGGEGDSAGWVPFHKLSQWLSYSLLEPLQWAGVEVQGLDALTALPEYRNGGLLLDSGWLRLRDPQLAERTWQVGDELVVEWRALTVALIDRLAPRVRERLGVDARRLPLASLLQGGTWSAGRELAQRLRGGLPPLQIASDGTVF